MGTPQQLTDQAGEVVWQVQYRTYGSVVKYELERVENNIRFPGQYYDAETGLHYNRHRYYHAGVGRFVCQDPIGLVGGINLYSYTHNPITWMDPMGLDDKECSKLSDNLYQRNRHLKREIVEEYDKINAGQGTPQVYNNYDQASGNIPAGMQIGDQKVFQARKTSQRKWEGATEWLVTILEHFQLLGSPLCQDSCPPIRMGLQ